MEQMSETAVLLGEDQMVEKAGIVLPNEMGQESREARWDSQVESGSEVQEDIVLKQPTWSYHSIITGISSLDDSSECFIHVLIILCHGREEK